MLAIKFFDLAKAEMGYGLKPNQLLLTASSCVGSCGAHTSGISAHSAHAGSVGTDGASAHTGCVGSSRINGQSRCVGCSVSCFSVVAASYQYTSQSENCKELFHVLFFKKC